MAGKRGVKGQFNTFDLERIRDMMTRGMTQAEIGRSYGVHASTISRLVSGNDLKNPEAPLDPLMKYIKDYRERFYPED